MESKREESAQKLDAILHQTEKDYQRNLSGGRQGLGADEFEMIHPQSTKPRVENDYPLGSVGNRTEEIRKLNGHMLIANNLLSKMHQSGVKLDPTFVSHAKYYASKADAAAAGIDRTFTGIVLWFVWNFWRLANFVFWKVPPFIATWIYWIKFFVFGYLLWWFFEVFIYAWRFGWNVIWVLSFLSPRYITRQIASTPEFFVSWWQTLYGTWWERMEGHLAGAKLQHQAAEAACEEHNWSNFNVHNQTFCYAKPAPNTSCPANMVDYGTYCQQNRSWAHFQLCNKRQSEIDCAWDWALMTTLAVITFYVLQSLVVKMCLRKYKRVKIVEGPMDLLTHSSPNGDMSFRYQKEGGRGKNKRGGKGWEKSQARDVQKATKKMSRSGYAIYDAEALQNFMDRDVQESEFFAYTKDGKEVGHMSGSADEFYRMGLYTFKERAGPGGYFVFKPVNAEAFQINTDNTLDDDKYEEDSYWKREMVEIPKRYQRRSNNNRDDDYDDDDIIGTWDGVKTEEFHAAKLVCEQVVLDYFSAAPKSNMTIREFLEHAIEGAYETMDKNQVLTNEEKKGFEVNLTQLILEAIRNNGTAFVAAVKAKLEFHLKEKEKAKVKLNTPIAPSQARVPLNAHPAPTDRHSYVSELETKVAVLTHRLNELTEVKQQPVKESKLELVVDPADHTLLGDLIDSVKSLKQYMVQSEKKTEQALREHREAMASQIDQVQMAHHKLRDHMDANEQGLIKANMRIEEAIKPKSVVKQVKDLVNDAAALSTSVHVAVNPVDADGDNVSKHTADSVLSVFGKIQQLKSNCNVAQSTGTVWTVGTRRYLCVWTKVGNKISVPTHGLKYGPEEGGLEFRFDATRWVMPDNWPREVNKEAITMQVPQCFNKMKSIPVVKVDTKFDASTPYQVETLQFTMGSDGQPKFDKLIDIMYNACLSSNSTPGRSGAPVVFNGHYIGFVQGEARINTGTGKHTATTVVIQVNPEWFAPKAPKKPSANQVLGN